MTWHYLSRSAVHELLVVLWFPLVAKNRNSEFNIDEMKISVKYCVFPAFTL